MDVNSFEVEVDGKKIEVVAKDDYSKSVDQLYREMKEAKEERDEKIADLKRVKSEYAETRTKTESLEKQIETLKKETSSEELAKLISERDDLLSKVKQSSEELEKVTGMLKSEKIDAVLRTELAKHTAPKALDAAVRLARESVIVDDEFNVKIVGDNGQPVRGQNGDPIGIADYAKQFISERDYFAAAPGGSGAGMSGKSGIPDGTKNWKEMSIDEQVKFREEHGMDETKKFIMASIEQTSKKE